MGIEMGMKILPGPLIMYLQRIDYDTKIISGTRRI